MKKLILTAAITAFVVSPVVAHAAAWTDSINADIASGKLSDIDRVAAMNPKASGDISVYLLERAQGELEKNPDLAIKLFAAAKPLASQISANDADKVVQVVLAFLNAARGLSTEEASCSGASEIYASALNMTSQQNLAARAASAHQSAASDAKDAIRANAACGTDDLNNEVSLAQFNTIPLTSNVGALVPSSD